jgi:hypothetical protein
MTREEAVALVRRYDAEKPSRKSLSIFLKYLDFNHEQLEAVIERWRNTRLWSGIKENSTLINQVY